MPRQNAGGGERKIGLAFGVNDTAEEVGKGLRVPQDRSLDLARSMLAKAKAWKPTLWIGPAPVVEAKQPLKPYPGLAYDFSNRRIAEINRAYAALAQDLAIPYLDVFSALSAEPAWSRHVDAGDGVHPVAEGYVAFARIVGTWPAWGAWLS